ncbi:TolB family protein [Shewanella pealeana]|uniref:WD40 domain protein beta Propeller n=1 Tax=Shewanella pealeana (strain ATCC 700345 / ANG-SQ1) TaxID=398579 RepID=A8H022_SHEPA|nr:PD40 domain-containing protein [Shewanella pealeana]ABV85909.1 WD40 domain protein beta Propeller [Shewanella pealeana ATCC 700345]
MPNNNKNSTLAGYAFLASLLFIPSSIQAAGFDIWIYSLDYDDTSQQWSLGEAKAVTERDGYDNQPSFSPDSQNLLFTSDRIDAQNDIYQYRLTDGTLSQLTFTPKQSEYSPQAFTNGTDSYQLKYVVEQGVPHQSVWQQTSNSPRKRAINSYIPTGYFASDERLGTLIWARYAYSLYFEPKGETADERHFVVENVGRSIHAIPNDQAFSYLHKQLDGDRVIKRFSPQDNSHSLLITLASSASEDYAWSQNNWLLNIDSGYLRGWNSASKQQADWQILSPIPAPSEHYLNASRIAVSPDSKHLAVVWQRK